MNQIEATLMHALFIHLHHNIDKAIDFGQFKQLNDEIDKLRPGLIMIGPDANDDAGVIKMPGSGDMVVGKMESHNSPCVVTPYDSAATGAGGAMRDVVAMGGRPLFVLDFIGTQPLENDVLVGPCAFDGDVCTCGNCVMMSNQERVNLMLKGIKDMCQAMGVFVIGGGFSTSFSDIVPACVVAVVGQLVTDAPLTKPAKNVGDKLILIGVTNNDGNDTLYRAGFVDKMRPATALFEEEKAVMEASIAAFETGKINACSDFGAAGIGAAVCESARYGGLGASVDLSLVPTAIDDISPEEVLICETQGRMLVQVNPNDVDEVLEAVRQKGVKATVIGEITDRDEAVFTFGDDTVAVIPNKPSAEVLEALSER